MFDVLSCCVWDWVSAIIYRELGLVRTDPARVVGSKLMAYSFTLVTVTLALDSSPIKTILLS
jgi:hypothetical protein